MKRDEMTLSQEVSIKLNIFIHSHVFQRDLWATALRMKNACNLLSKFIFNALPYMKNLIMVLGLHNSLLSRVPWSNHYYHLVRNRCGLTGQETSDVFTHVLGKYKAVKTQMKKHMIRYYNRHTGKHYYPTKITQIKKPILFKRPWIIESRGKSWSFTHDDKGHKRISIGTVFGRIKLFYKIPPYFRQYLKPNTKFGTAQVLHQYPSRHYKKGRWTIHIVCKVPTKPLTHKHTKHLVGADRSIDNIIWTYDNKNHTYHVSGKNVLRTREHYKHLRTQIQSKHSHAAHRKIVNLSHKENRWRQNVNFKIIKTLYKMYPTSTMFGVEDLTGIRKALIKVPKWRRYTQVSWDYYDLQSKMGYKANLHESLVVHLDPQNTSIRCPIGFEIMKSNRHHDVHAYICTKHHCQYNDDMVGSINIFDLLKMFYHGVKNPSFRVKKKSKKKKIHTHGRHGNK